MSLESDRIESALRAGISSNEELRLRVLKVAAGLPRILTAAGVAPDETHRISKTTFNRWSMCSIVGQALIGQDVVPVRRELILANNAQRSRPGRDGHLLVGILPVDSDGFPLQGSVREVRNLDEYALEDLDNGSDRTRDIGPFGTELLVARLATFGAERGVEWPMLDALDYQGVPLPAPRLG